MRFALIAGLAVGFLAVAGCSRQQTTNPSPLAPKGSLFGGNAQLTKNTQTASRNESMTNVRKAPDGPKRPPKVETCLIAGQSFLDSAETSDEPALRVQRLAQARKAFEQALELDPTNLKAALGLARVCDKEGDYLSAEAGYREVLKSVPDARVWYDLGMCHARQKQWNEAVEALRQAAKLAPNNSTYSSHLGWALARSGQYEAALKHFRRTVGVGRANYNLALMMSHLGYTDHCRMYLRAALKAEPNLEDARVMLDALEPAAPTPAPRTANAKPKPASQPKQGIVPVDFRETAPAKPKAKKPAATAAAKPIEPKPVKTRITSLKSEPAPEATPAPGEPAELKLKATEEAPLPAADTPAPDVEDSSAEAALEKSDSKRTADAPGQEDE